MYMYVAPCAEIWHNIQYKKKWWKIHKLFKDKYIQSKDEILKVLDKKLTCLQFKDNVQFKSMPSFKDKDHVLTK